MANVNGHDCGLTLVVVAQSLIEVTEIVPALVRGRESCTIIIPVVAVELVIGVVIVESGGNVNCIGRLSKGAGGDVHNVGILHKLGAADLIRLTPVAVAHRAVKQALVAGVGIEAVVPIFQEFQLHCSGRAITGNIVSAGRPEDNVGGGIGDFCSPDIGVCVSIDSGSRLSHGYITGKATVVPIVNFQNGALGIAVCHGHGGGVGIDACHFGPAALTDVVVPTSDGKAIIAIGRDSQIVRLIPYTIPIIISLRRIQADENNRGIRSGRECFIGTIVIGVCQGNPFTITISVKEVCTQASTTSTPVSIRLQVDCLLAAAALIAQLGKCGIEVDNLIAIRDFLGTTDGAESTDIGMCHRDCLRLCMGAVIGTGVSLDTGRRAGSRLCNYAVIPLVAKGRNGLSISLVTAGALPHLRALPLTGGRGLALQDRKLMLVSSRFMRNRQACADDIIRESISTAGSHKIDVACAAVGRQNNAVGSIRKGCIRFAVPCFRAADQALELERISTGIQLNRKSYLRTGNSHGFSGRPVAVNTHQIVAGSNLRPAGSRSIPRSVGYRKAIAGT